MNLQAELLSGFRAPFLLDQIFDEDGLHALMQFLVGVIHESLDGLQDVLQVLVRRTFFGRKDLLIDRDVIGHDLVFLFDDAGNDLGIRHDQQVVLFQQIDVVVELGVQLGEGEQLRLARKKSPNVEAYKHWWKGVDEFRKFTEESNQKTRELAEKALEIDPQYTLAYSLIAWTYYSEVALGWSKNPAQSMEKIDQYINKALEVDPDSGDVPNLLTCVYALKGQYDQAISQGRRAVERWPSICDSHAMLAWALVKAGQPAEAIEEITKAMRLAPSYPTWFLDCLGQSYFLVGRYEEAIVAFKKYLELEPQIINYHAWLAAVYSAMGQENQARIEAKELLKKRPTFSLEQWGSNLQFKDEAVNDRIIFYARKAGLPE